MGIFRGSALDVGFNDELTSLRLYPTRSIDQMLSLLDYLGVSCSLRVFESSSLAVHIWTIAEKANKFTQILGS